ncbi:g5135 [Coccomyxa elongata]
MLEELSPLDGWAFGKLPRARSDWGLLAELPERLRELLHLQPTLLRQLSLVKLRIIARAYFKLYPNDDPACSEDELCNLMQAAIRIMIQDWQPASTLLPAWPCPYVVDREAEVRSCVNHWLNGWADGARGRAINVCCHEIGMGKTTLMRVLGNPMERYIDAFVGPVTMDIKLDALMVLLCVRLVHVQMGDMPDESESLGQAVAVALKHAAFRMKGMPLEPLDSLDFRNEGFLGTMWVIQEQLAVPLIVVFDAVHAINSTKYNSFFKDELEEHPHCNTSDMREVLKARRFLEEMSSLFGDPHFFYAAVRRSLGLALLSGSLTAGAATLFSINDSRVSLYARLGLKPDSTAADEFCRYLEEMVAGVPALLVSVLEGCLETEVRWGEITPERMGMLLSDEGAAAEDEDEEPSDSTSAEELAQAAASPCAPAPDAMVSSSQENKPSMGSNALDTTGKGIQGANYSSILSMLNRGMLRLKTAKCCIAAYVMEDSVATVGFTSCYRVPLVLQQLIEGGEQLIVPRVVLANREVTIGWSVLPVLSAHLNKFAESGLLRTSKYPIVRVPGFSDMAASLKPADVRLSGFLEDAWRHNLRIEDFGKIIKEAPK